jgi:hypothetical protein
MHNGIVTDTQTEDSKQAQISKNHQPFNLTCDPTNHYTTGGGHTGIYCNGWKNGYTATWNNLVQANPGGPKVGTTHETQPEFNNITSERYNMGFRDGAIQAKNDFNNGTKYSNLSCGLTLPQPMLAYCMGHFEGYKISISNSRERQLTFLLLILLNIWQPCLVSCR